MSTEPHCADDTNVFAATETGGALPNPVTGRWWILAHYPDDTPHDEALAELGYQVVEPTPAQED
ncbi:hypothetical protein CH289_15905 [Rhodococcus sp. RS1C4]|nr:hypothetical protein [Rhodococcus sp. RS1C4]OZC50510.1 hypothetical protein CH289_15905 [Rhodococcus sp. RS1C4]